MGIEIGWVEDRRTRGQVEMARQLLADRRRLSAVEWAAWVWMMTGVSTVPQCWIPDGESGRRYTGFQCKPARGLERGDLDWSGPERIARRGGPWDVASGGQMANWCLLLEGVDDRQAALAANGSLADVRLSASIEAELVAAGQQIIGDDR